MRYYKKLKDGYLLAIGTGPGSEEITAEEYENILTIIRSRPTAEAGYGYRLKADMTWELYEVPVVDDSENYITGDEFMSMVEEAM